jgi:O-antigen ligase
MFENPNDLALHLVTMIPIAVVLVPASSALPRKLFYGACAALAVVGLVPTFSRGGFVGFACAGAVLVWRLSRRYKALVLLLLPLMLVLLILVAPSGYGNRLATTGDDSTVARTDDLKRSLLIAARHPLFGVGMENYALYSNSEHATHNAYTQVASELGLTAAVVYVLFLVAPLKQLRRISRETESGRSRSRFFYLSAGLEASLIGFMVCSFFASVAYLWYAYYLVAYAICLRQLHDSEKARQSKKIAYGVVKSVEDSSLIR